MKLFSVAQRRPRDCVGRTSVTSVNTATWKNDWESLSCWVFTWGPPSSHNGQRVVWGVPLNQDSQALSPLKVWSMRGTSISCKASEQGEETRRVVGMHIMGWTSDLTSKHGTHGKGMEERDTWQGRHYKQKSVFGYWDTYHHNIPNSKTACIRTKKQQI